MGSPAQPLLDWAARMKAMPGQFANAVEHPVDTVENWMRPAPTTVQAAPAAPQAVPLPAAWEQANQKALQQNQSQGSMVSARRPKK